MGAHARAAGGGPNRASHRARPNYERISRAALLTGASAFALAVLGASGVARAACGKSEYWALRIESILALATRSKCASASQLARCPRH